MLLFVGMEYAGYLSKMLFSFPRHLLTTIFCIISLIIYPLVIFKNKDIKIVGLIISAIIIILIAILCIINPIVYDTYILSNGEKYTFDDSYKVYLVDKEYGDLTIKYDNGVEDWMVFAEFRKAGKTQMILESPDGEKKSLIFQLAVINIL